MPSDLSAGVRQLVVQRAGNRCEYCLLPQSFSLHKHEPDHIVPRQHDGNTDKRNLALSCMHCNRYKGPNVGSFDPQTGALVPFFNPRTQDWNRHFKLEKGVIRALTAEARVTVKILRFNDEERIAERQRLIELDLYE